MPDVPWCHLLGAIPCPLLANTREEAAQIGFDDEFIYREMPLAPAIRAIPGVHLRTPLSDLPFAEWAAKPDKIRY